MISPVGSLSRRIGGAGLDFTRWASSWSRGSDTDSLPGHISDARKSTPVSGKRAKLCSTFFLSLPADEALEALRKLGMERFALEFVTIPADGGCVVAVFSPPFRQRPLLSKFRLARELQSVIDLLKSIGATAITCNVPRAGVYSS